MCKEDKSNLDMLDWEAKSKGEGTYDVTAVWAQPTIQSALEACTTASEVMATIQAFNYKLRPQVEPKPFEWMWQDKLCQELTHPDGHPPLRTIRWYFDVTGGKGKTLFVRGIAVIILREARPKMDRRSIFEAVHTYHQHVCLYFVF